MKNTGTKSEQILAYLALAPHSWVSGEAISAKLGISRAAVAKHIATLRRNGYDITASTGRGYILSGETDIYNGEMIKRYSKRVRDVIFLQTVDSTNLYAKQIAIKGAPNGTLVTAAEQTQGRGRLGREWVSPIDNGLYLTMIIRPKIDIDKAPLVTFCAALAVIEAIKECCDIDTDIKWPNDILLYNKKLCGILTEMAAGMDGLEWFAVGMGINILNAPQVDSPTGATALHEYVHDINRAQLVATIADKLIIWTELLEQDAQAVLNSYRAVCVTIGAEVHISMADNAFNAVAVGIAENGALIVQTPQGEVTVHAGDVTLRRDRA